MITYSIIYDFIDYAKIEGGLTDVIKTIYFTVTGVDADGTSAIFKTKLDYDAPDANSFTPFNLITEEIIYNWINNSSSDIMSIAKRSIDYQIAEIQESNIVKNSKYPFQ